MITFIVFMGIIFIAGIESYITNYKVNKFLKNQEQKNEFEEIEYDSLVYEFKKANIYDIKK